MSVYNDILWYYNCAIKNKKCIRIGYVFASGTLGKNTIWYNSRSQLYGYQINDCIIYSCAIRPFKYRKNVLFNLLLCVFSFVFKVFKKNSYYL